MAANQTLPSFAQAFSSIPAPKHKQDPDDPAPAPAPPSKRRRVTISGAPRPPVPVAPLNTNVAVPNDHASSTPISPVVMGLTITPDNPLAIEKVKSMISVKQKQKALIQQRRGSAATPMSPTVPPAPSDPKASRPRRVPSSRPPSPPQPSHTNALPPPPISFARRRAEQLGSAQKKPADILISPRDPQSQPAIQSAPPVTLGRFPMALPRLPAVLRRPDPIVRRVASAVPPTPTGLSLQRSAPRRSPPTASVPIASTLVPTTPALFHHPAYPTDKAAFLAPFELFYDALNDSKQLKSWLADQLQRSNAIIQALSQQQENINELVEDLVEKQLAPMRQEVLGLQRRVEELEDALRSGPKHKVTRTSLRNGITNSPIPTESYSFPPSAGLEPSLSSRRRTEISPHSSSPSWGPDRDTPIIIADADSETPEPAPPRRIESSRSMPLEPPPLPPPPRLSPRAPFDHALASSPKPKTPAERPNLSRQPSTHSPAGEREEKKRNSVIMSPPDAPGSEG